MISPVIILPSVTWGIRVKFSALEDKYEIGEAPQSSKEHITATNPWLGPNGSSTHCLVSPTATLIPMCQIPSQFTTKFTGAVDVCHRFDKRALRLIEGQIKPEGLSILEAIYSLTDFKPTALLRRTLSR